MPRQIITSPKVITPRRAFSNGVRVGHTLYVAGQLPIDLDGNVVGAGDIRVQTRQVLENVRAIVEAAGGTLRDVIKTTVYLTDIAHHGAMNEVYSCSSCRSSRPAPPCRWLGSPRPSRVAAIRSWWKSTR